MFDLYIVLTSRLLCPVQFPLRRKDLSVWSTVRQEWSIPKGKITLSVGSSSRNIHDTLKHTF